MAGLGMRVLFKSIFSRGTTQRAHTAHCMHVAGLTRGVGFGLLFLRVFKLSGAIDNCSRLCEIVPALQTHGLRQYTSVPCHLPRHPHREGAHGSGCFRDACFAFPTGHSRMIAGHGDVLLWWCRPTGVTEVVWDLACLWTTVTPAPPPPPCGDTWLCQVMIAIKEIAQAPTCTAKEKRSRLITDRSDRP